MELPEEVNVINKRLLDYYGKTDDGQHYRVVWSDDEFEKRKGKFIKHDLHNNPIGEFEGVELRPKYSHYIQHKYILERFLYVPENVETDIVEKFSYEPIWTFQDKQGNPLPPKWEVIEIVIDSIMRAAAKAVGAKYKETNESHTLDELKKYNSIREELFGNETKIGDALAYKDGVSLTGPRLTGEGEKQ